MAQQDTYQVIARKYRPKKFSEVLGQDTIITILKNAIFLKQVSHAYIFSGTRGTGKTTLARIFSKCLNCLHREQEIEPCNHCESCQEITHSQSIDVLEIDGASHRSIEDIRYINDTIAFSPIKLPFKIFIIDEVHMLTKEAFNALLKTLEEPPAHIKFLFATTELHKIPETILSRCQVLTLKRLTSEKIIEKLSLVLNSLSITFEEEALKKIAERAEGSLRDAESLLEQLLAFNPTCLDETSVSTSLGIAHNRIIEDINQAILTKNYEMIFSAADTIFREGYQINYFLEQLINYFKNILLTQFGSNPLTASPHYSEETLLSILEFLGESSFRLKQTIFEKSFLEIVLLQLIKIHSLPSMKSVVQTLNTLEKEVFNELSKTSPASLSKKTKQTTSEDQTNCIQNTKNTRIVTAENTTSVQNSPSSINEVTRSNDSPEIIISYSSTKEVISPKKINTLPSLNTNKEQKQILSSEEKIQSDILMHFAAVEFNSTLIKE